MNKDGKGERREFGCKGIKASFSLAEFTKTVGHLGAYTREAAKDVGRRGQS